MGKPALLVLDEVPNTVGTGNKVITSAYKVNPDFESLEETLLINMGTQIALQ